MDFLTSPSLVMDAISKAEAELREYVGSTPLEYSSDISNELGVEIFFKREDKRVTGSFKAVPALYSILSAQKVPSYFLSSSSGRQKVTRHLLAESVVASGGNFGLGYAHWLKTLKRRGVIYLPKNVDAEKLRRMQSEWVEIRFAQDYDAAENAAIAHAKDVGIPFFSPYSSDAAILANATIGAELLGQFHAMGVGAPDAVFVALSGGGLASGISLAIHHREPSVKIHGVGILESPAMVASLRAGKIVQVPCRDSLAEPLVGNMEPQSQTFAICQKHLASWSEVSEVEIRGAMRFLARHQIFVEGAGAVAMAAVIQDPKRWAEKKVALLICGGNIAPHRLAEILAT